MHWNPQPDGACKCGAPHSAHIWLCDECGTPAYRLALCGCGAVHLPERGCQCSGPGMSLYCPAAARIIDDEGWTDHLRALATYKKLRMPGKHGRFRTQEAERLRGASA